MFFSTLFGSIFLFLFLFARFSGQQGVFDPSTLKLELQILTRTKGEGKGKGKEKLVLKGRHIGAAVKFKTRVIFIFEP